MQLGQTPLIRRIITAVILAAATVVTAVMRHKGADIWFNLVIYLIAAAIAFTLLHYRWKAKEKHQISPKKVKDIFS